jgi:hypothetical protein
MKQNNRLAPYYAKGPHILFGKVVAGQPHAGGVSISPVSTISGYHIGTLIGASHPDVTPFFCPYCPS